MFFFILIYIISFSRESCIFVLNIFDRKNKYERKCKLTEILLKMKKLEKSCKSSPSFQPILFSVTLDFVNSSNGRLWLTTVFDVKSFRYDIKIDKRHLQNNECRNNESLHWSMLFFWFFLKIFVDGKNYH